jgi:hypothetical protein
MGFSLGRLLDPIGIIPGVGKGKGSIKNGFDALGLFTPDANAAGGGGAGYQDDGMDPSLEQAVMAYYASNPAFAAEYNRHMSQARGTDNRSPAEWLFDGIQSNPAELTNFKAFNSGGGQQPGEEGEGAEGPVVPAEQALLETVLNDYVFAGIDGDKDRQAEAAAILKRINAGIDNALAVNNEVLSGQRLQDEYDMADTTGGKLATSANDEATTLRAALADLDTQRRTALDPLLAERLAAAETSGAAVRQGLESERDRITAEQAMGGFYGGSSLTDGAMTRASIAAQQQAAELLGGAKVANATDVRGIGDDTARAGFDISGRQASGVRGAADYTTNLRQNYFDADYPRRLNAAFAVPGIEGTRFTFGNQADDYGQTGLRRGLQLLDWFSGGGQAPAVSPYQETASQAGNDLAGLGTGLVSSGFNWLAANRKPAATSWGTWNAPQSNYATSIGGTLGLG